MKEELYLGLALLVEKLYQPIYNVGSAITSATRSLRTIKTGTVKIGELEKEVQDLEVKRRHTPEEREKFQQALKKVELIYNKSVNLHLAMGATATYLSENLTSEGRYENGMLMSLTLVLLIPTLIFSYRKKVEINEKLDQLKEIPVFKY